MVPVHPREPDPPDLPEQLGDTVRVLLATRSPVETGRALWTGDGAVVDSSMPVQRLDGPRDIAEAGLYLGSDESAWVTGQNLLVDSGFLIRSVQ